MSWRLWGSEVYCYDYHTSPEKANFNTSHIPSVCTDEFHQFYDGNQLITTLLFIFKRLVRRSLSLCLFQFKFFLMILINKFKLFNQAGTVIHLNKSPTSTVLSPQPMPAAISIPIELFSQDEWYHERKEKMVKYGIHPQDNHYWSESSLF